jgi:hypothetical protein
MILPFFHRPEPRIVLGSGGPLGLFPTSLPLKDFDTHMYIVGKTKKGKSSFMLSLAQQLIEHHQGMGLIDPHGDLVSDLLSYLASYPKGNPWLANPVNRRRIIYFDPTISEYVVPFNPLAANSVLPYVTAQAVVEAFRRCWHEELKAAPRFTNLALYSFMALIENHLSLVELPRFLTDHDYRGKLLGNVHDQRVREFFIYRYNRWGKEAPQMIESLLNKATALTLNDFLYPILSASTCLNLREIMDQGKILLVNLHTQEEETKNLLGSLLMSFFEQAALSRPQSQRRPFFLLVDEFQKFCANSGSVATLAEILSECRKYRLHLCFAHQSWAQIGSHDRLVGALEQAQIKVVFGTGRQTAQAIVGELYNPDLQAVKHEIEDEQQQVRSHPLYSPLTEQFESFTQRIQRLKRREIIVQMPERDGVVSLKTLTVPKAQLQPEALKRIKLVLAKLSGYPRKQLVPKTARQLPQEPAREPPPLSGVDEEEDYWG